jgi:Flp pilus assembly protein TadD
MAKKKKLKVQDKTKEKILAQKNETKLKNHFIFCLIIFVLTFAVYFNSLKNEFVYDDIGTIVENNFIKNIENVKYVFTPTYFKLFTAELTYRPICTITYFIDYFLYKLNPKGFHLTNILFHILNSILIYFLALTIFKEKYILSLFTSLLFALHPIATEPVNAISFREDLLAMCFFLISFLFYIKYFNSKKIIFFILSLIAFIISLFSKESAVVLPLILILYTFSFSGIKEVFKRKYYYSIYFIILAIYIYLTRYSIFSNPYYIAKPAQDTGGTYFTFLTMLKVFAYYIKLLILPLNLRPDYVIPISHSLSEPMVILSILVLVTTLAIGILMFKKNKIIFFAIFYFFICLAPVSNIIRIVVLMAERFLYIPYLGFCIGASILFDKLSKSYKSIFLIFLLIYYSILTFNQNKIWKNEIILWEITLKRCPNSVFAYNNLGLLYGERGQFDKAEEYSKKAIEMDKNLASAYNNLGIVYDEKGLPDEAEKYYKKAIELNKNFAEPYNNLGVIYERKGLLDKAEEYYKKAIELDENFTKAYNNLGVIYGKKGELDKAEECFKKAINVDKNFSNAYYNLGIVYEKRGLLDKAKEYYNKAIEKNKEKEEKR